jgi:hypothetical protein
MRIIDYFFISVTEGVICKIKMKTFGSEREIQVYANLMENRLPIFRNNTKSSFANFGCEY